MMALEKPVAATRKPPIHCEQTVLGLAERDEKL